jgi:hypothetical protein
LKLAMLLVAAAIYAPFGELPAPDCWAQNPAGDRLEFTDNPYVWVFNPAGVEPDDFEYEGCAYGLDPDVGTHTLTCETAGIDAPVLGTAESGLEINGVIWKIACPIQT